MLLVVYLGFDCKALALLGVLLVTCQARAPKSNIQNEDNAPVIWSDKEKSQAGNVCIKKIF